MHFIDFVIMCFKNDFNFRIVENDLFESYSQIIYFNLQSFNHLIDYHKKVVAVIVVIDKHDSANIKNEIDMKKKINFATRKRC